MEAPYPIFIQLIQLWLTTQTHIVDPTFLFLVQLQASSSSSSSSGSRLPSSSHSSPMEEVEEEEKAGAPSPPNVRWHQFRPLNADNAREAVVLVEHLDSRERIGGTHCCTTSNACWALLLTSAWRSGCREAATIEVRHQHITGSAAQRCCERRW